MIGCVPYYMIRGLLSMIDCVAFYMIIDFVATVL